MWKVTFNTDDWTLSTCLCPVFQKQYYCKDWLGVAVRKKLITVCDKSTTILVKPSRGRPFDYKTEDLSRRLRGRPAKVAPALVIESSAASGAAKRARGRPKKRALNPTPNLEDSPEPPKKKRGRPRTRPLTPPTLTTTDNHLKRKRGRPKKKFNRIMMTMNRRSSYVF